MVARLQAEPEAKPGAAEARRRQHALWSAEEQQARVARAREKLTALEAEKQPRAKPDS